MSLVATEVMLTRIRSRTGSMPHGLLFTPSISHVLDDPEAVIHAYTPAAPGVSSQCLDTLPRRRRRIVEPVSSVHLDWSV
jgi:hypothetical protein